MMKKAKHLWLVVLLLCGLSMGVTSCSDDKNNSSNGEQTDDQADKDMADAAVFWSVVGQLTDTPMPDNWQNATYEPSIGEPDATNSAIRIVNCADEESAAASASDLLGTSITTATQSYTYQNDLVGKLTYRKTGGSSLATVDVSIQQMPGLSQIVYKTPEQIGENASFKGTAYYRFGDVVKKLNKDGEYDYWICVRPCLSFVSKTDSHWMTLSKLPSDYVKEQKKTVNNNKFAHQLPKNLANNSDHMQNLAEMVYAMTCPTDWATNLSTNKGYQKLKYFKDLNYEKHFKYNNEWFFSNVAEGWETSQAGNLFQTIFGLSREDLKAHVQAKGFAMVYGNATMSSNDITLTVYKYDGTNLKTKSSVKSTGKWEYAAFDINQLMSKHYIDNDMVVPAEDGRYWVARYATGETLAKGADATKFDTYKKMPNCEDVFVYNRDVEHFNMTEETLKATEPKVAGEHGNQKGYYQLGDVIKYNNRYYVCASNHDFGGTARFVTLNDQETHKTGTFNWSGIGQDVVYSDEMASAETLADWMKNILFDEDQWRSVCGTLADKGIAEEQWNQVVPQNEAMRFLAMNQLCDLERAFNNVNIPMGDAMQMYYTDGNITTLPFTVKILQTFIWEYIHDYEGNPLNPGFDKDAEENICIYRAAPAGLLLANKLRWSEHIGSSWDQWVPYVRIFREKNGTWEKVQNELNQMVCMGTLSPSHFQWRELGTLEVPEEIVKPQGIEMKDEINKGTYHICLMAVYWQHEMVDYNDIWIRFLLDFTKDWHDKPNGKSKLVTDPNYLWYRRNITSREITFTDEGKKQTKYTSVSVAGER